VKGTGDQDATAIEVQSWRSAVHVPIGSIVGEADASRLPVAATLAGGLVLGREFRLPEGDVPAAQPVKSMEPARIAEKRTLLIVQLLI
jgi:hypothetical protein